MVSQMYDFNSSQAFRVSGKKAFDEAGIKHADVDHLMIYDAFAHLPLYGLEDLGFCKPGEAAAFIRERNTAIGGKLPLNTNGGGLSYMHSGMYGMYAMQESVRQMRGIAPAQVPGAKLSISHGVGGMFAASGTIVFTNEGQGWSGLSPHESREGRFAREKVRFAERACCGVASRTAALGGDPGCGDSGDRPSEDLLRTGHLRSRVKPGMTSAILGRSIPNLPKPPSALPPDPTSARTWPPRRGKGWAWSCRRRRA